MVGFDFIYHKETIYSGESKNWGRCFNLQDNNYIIIIIHVILPNITMRAWYLINLFKIIFSLAVSHVQQYFTIAVISSFGTDKNAINHNVYFALRLSGLIGSTSFNFNFEFSPDTEMSRLLPHILCLLLIDLFSRTFGPRAGNFFLTFGHGKL